MRRIRTKPPTPLSLRSKALVLTGAIAAILLVLLYVLARLILFNSFADLEKKEVVRDAHRVVNVLHNDQADLSQTASDWANWDDTYAFVANGNAAYIESNLIDDTFATLQIDLMMFVDESGHLVYGKAFRPGSDEPILLDSPSVLNAIYGDGPLSHYRDYVGPDDSMDGLVITPDGPMMITVQPIRRSDRPGPPRGGLVMGRYLDPARIAHIAQVADVQLVLRYVDDPSLPQDFKTAVTHLEAGTDMWTRALNGDVLAGYGLLNDISGSPVLVLRIGLPRDISHEGQQTVWFFLLAAAILALSLIGVSAGLVERVVLVRLLRLSQAVRQISRSSDPNGRVPVSGGDELAELGQYLNEMLAAIQKSQDELWSSEARYRTLFESANDAILLMRHDVFIDCNPRALVMFGCTREQIVHQTPYADYFSPPLQPDGHSSRERLLEKVNQALTGFPQHFEWQHTRYDGTPFDADVTLTPLELSGEVLLQMMIQDVTERRLAEEALRESEEEFSRLFDRIPVNLYRTTPDGQLIMANPALLTLLGYPDLDALQSDSTVRFYVDPADRDRWRAQLERDGMLSSFRTRLRRSDGTPIWVEDTARAVRSRDSHTLYYEGALKDITEQVQAEAERERLLNQMQVRAAELATVAEISHQITTILDIDALLWEVSRLIKENFDLYHVHIYLLHGDTLKLAAGEGEVGRQLVARGHTIPLNFEHSLVARTARTREVVRVNDVSGEPDFMGDDLLPDTRSEMAIPIIMGDELLGVLNVESDRVGRFTQEDVNIKTTLAAQVAIAIHNARLFTDSARRLAIIENSNDLIALARLDTYEPLYINAAGLRLLGYEEQPEAYFAQTIRNHYPLKELDLLRQDAIPIVRAQGFWRGENRIKRRDGTELPVEQMIFAIPDKDGHPRDLATIMIDITARKQAERALQRASRAYHILSDCSQTMVRAVREDRLLDEICAIIVNTGSYRFAWVAYADGTDPQVTHPMAYAGFEAGYLTATQACRTALPLGPSRKAIQTGETHIVRDIASDPDYEPWQEAALKRGYHAMIALPLQVTDEVFGSLNVYAAEPDAFDNEEIALLIELASDLAYGITVLRTRIERQQVVEQLQQVNAHLEKRNAQLLALHEITRTLAATLDVHQIYQVMYDEVAQRLLGAQHFTVALYDAVNERIICDFSIIDGEPIDVTQLPQMPLGSGPNSETIRTRQPRIVALPASGSGVTTLGRFIHIGDEREPRSALYVPLISGNTLIGVMNVQHYAPDAFQDADINILSIIANQAATAIHNAQLFAATQQHAVDLQAQTERLALVNRVSAMLSQTLDEQMVYSIAVHELQTALATQYAGLVLFQPDGETGYLVMDTHPTRHTDRDQPIPLEANPSIEHVRRTRRPLVSSDVLHDPLFAPVRDLLRARGTVSLVIVPLVVGDEVIGTLGLDSTTPREFSEAECDLLATIANQVSIAIAKAQLYAAERDQRIFAEALSATAAAVSSTLDFNNVLDRILENVGRAIPHDASNIMLLEGDIARVVRSRGYGAYGVADDLQRARYVIADALDWQDMLQSGRPFAIPATAQDPVWRPQPEGEWIRSTIKAPIIIEGEIIGILHLDSETPGAFSQHDADRLKAFADQAAMAIHNARLFTAERDQRIFAEALSETAMALTGSLTLDEVSGHILSHIGRVIPHDAANLLLVNLETRRGKIIGCRGYEDHGGNEAKLHDDVPLNFIDELAPGRAIIIDDVTAEPRWSDIPEDRWIRAFIGIPIHLDGQIIGMLNLDSATPDRFTEAHAARLQAFADQAALAIRSAQLFERVQQHAAELEQRVEARTKELEQQRAQLQAILDSMGEGVIYDENLEVKHTNRALTELTGYPPSDFASHPYLEPLCRATHTPAEFDALIRELYDMVDQEGIWRGETLLQRADGSRFDAALTATSVRNAQGEVIGAVTVIRDISQEKALQEQRVRFIANASHELRTPLANIKTRLYLLQRQPEKAEQHIRILNQVSDGMAELVENLLDVSRFERGKIPLHRRETDLQELVNRVVRIQQAEAERKGIALVTRLHPEPLLAYVDPQRMVQVITNLVGNAINYTSESGQITVELETEGHRAVLCVRDTGIGIAPAMVEHIFEPFFRAEERSAIGTGLGLTIAREIVVLHGGEISVESEVGQGSTFTVKIDLLAEQPEIPDN